MTWDIELARGGSEFEQILELQWQNHLTQVTPEHARAQGFVTARHSLESLTGMHALAPSVLAWARPGGQLAGYALTMLREARALVPILEPMFQLLESLSWRGSPLATLDYYVMGQICVAEPFRGQGMVGRGLARRNRGPRLPQSCATTLSARRACSFPSCASAP